MATSQGTLPNRKAKKIHVLLRELSDDKDDMVDIGLDVLGDPQCPWLHDYHTYIDFIEQIPDGWSAVQWWGVRHF